MNQYNCLVIFYHMCTERNTIQVKLTLLPVTNKQPRMCLVSISTWMDFNNLLPNYFTRCTRCEFIYASWVLTTPDTHGWRGTAAIIHNNYLWKWVKMKTMRFVTEIQTSHHLLLARWFEIVNKSKRFAFTIGIWRSWIFKVFLWISLFEDLSVTWRIMDERFVSL